MIEPECRSPWISACASPRNFSLYSCAARFHGPSARTAAAVRSSCGLVQRLASASRQGSVKTRSSVMRQSSVLPQNSAMCFFFCAAGWPRSEVANSVSAMKVAMWSASRG